MLPPAQEDSGYDDYIREEWRLFHADPSRHSITLQALGDRTVNRVLDIGCGAGQELLPFLEQRSAFGVALDLSAEVGLTGTELLLQKGLEGRFAFLRGRAEQLPCRDASFDVVVCRLVLPYTINASALGEISRVARTGALVFIKIHHPRFYLLELRQALLGLKPRQALHSLRVFVAGAFYWLFGRQPSNRFTGSEVFQTQALLKRELRGLSLAIRDVLPGDLLYAPSFLLVKE